MARKNRSKLSLLHIVGARPNFMKLASVYSSISRMEHVSQTIVHTGQHSDPMLSQTFLTELRIPRPNINLQIYGNTPLGQVGQILTRLDSVLRRHKPDLVIVYGDVNSTLAGALAASKANIPLAHVEAGLRSGDRLMSEEINRIVVDQLAGIHFIHSPEARSNLLREGISPKSIFMVGNSMIDTLIRFRQKAVKPKEVTINEEFALVTLHRPSNVDDRQNLGRIILTLSELSEVLPLIFPVHPRTKKTLARIRLPKTRLRFCKPFGYFEFIWLEMNAVLVITDSGGVQEETTFLGTPCITVRETTERPITLTKGTNILVGTDMALLKRKFLRIVAKPNKFQPRIPLWDGRTGERIAKVLMRIL